MKCFLVLCFLSLLVALFEIEVSPDSNHDGFGGGYLVERLAIVCIALVLMLIGVFEKKILLLGSSILAVSIFSFIILIVIDDHQYKVTTKRGELIVAALDSYKVDIDKYPNNLGQLVPKYIDDIPKTSIGITARQFSYSIGQGEFDLVFKDGTGLDIGYSSRTRYWRALITGVP